MVKEFRALSRAEAVESMYQDMAARHRARFRNVQILRVAEIEKKEDVRRPYIKQLLEPGLKFPLPHRRTTSKGPPPGPKQSAIGITIAATVATAAIVVGVGVVGRRIARGAVRALGRV
jgi:ribosomal protein L20A (L18A)